MKVIDRTPLTFKQLITTLVSTIVFIMTVSAFVETYRQRALNSLESRLEEKIVLLYKNVERRIDYLEKYLMSDIPN